MNLKKDFIKQVEEIVGIQNVRKMEPMGKYTTFKVGGPADLLVYPSDYKKIMEIIKLCVDNEIDYFVMGNGSNLIVRDGGFRGVIINLTHLDAIKVEDKVITAQCGALLSRVSRTALSSSLKGLEFAAGIPGSIGGAIAMNAGAYGGEMSMVVESALLIDDHGQMIELSNKQLELSYRNSAVLRNNYIVLETKIRLERGIQDEIKAMMDDFAERRRSKQPLEYPSAGSTFKRPEGYFAGKLIQDAGLKGKCVGDAQVSEKHSGFIINKGSASAKNILDLIKVVQETVHNMFGVELKTEVRIIGED